MDLCFDRLSLGCRRMTWHLVGGVAFGCGAVVTDGGASFSGQ